MQFAFAEATVQQFRAQSTRHRLDSHKEHVLLIEPNALWAEVATQSLEDHGYRVTWMRSEQEAIEALIAPSWSSAACSAELILMDIDRPGADAVAFVQALPQLTNNAPPIVLIAAQPVEQLMRTAHEAGAAGWVCKPYAMDDLLLTVRHSLRRNFAEE